MKRLHDIPLILILTGIACLAMYVPAIYAAIQSSYAESRAFFYSGTLGLFLILLVSIIIRTSNPVRRARRRGGLADLGALFLTFAVLPLFLALPFSESLKTTSYSNAYLEMVSSVTTTGASLFAPDRLSDTLHLWRALVGWLGGLLIWISAAAILAPLNLGGFEVTASAEPGQGESSHDRHEKTNPAQKFDRSARALVPVYAGLTLVLWMCLVVSGDSAFVGAIHAMSTLATSGISSIGGIDQAASGFAGEAVIFLFLFFALSRLTFSADTLTSIRPGLIHDPEFRIGVLLIIGVPIILFLRHWVAAIDVDSVENLSAAMQSLWGGMFTTLSFLATAGFESAAWGEVRNWSGLGTPGIILLGLALVGGGVATTAGGVKLLRVYVLYLNGLQEMDRLVHPSSVGKASSHSRRIRSNGAYAAWIFFMLFALSLALISLALAAFGVGFEDSLIMAVAALTTTGPLIEVAGENPVVLSQLGIGAKMVFSAAMVIGRLETLAIIALVNLALSRG